MENRDILKVMDWLKDSTKDVRDMLVAWTSDNNTKTWSERLRYIQSKKHRALHSGIKASPYEAMFGTAQRIGLGDSLFFHSVHLVINMTLDTSSSVYNLHTSLKKQSFTLHIT